MKVDRAAILIHVDIVNPAEKIVRVGVHSVRGARRVDIGPTARDPDIPQVNMEESQYRLRRCPDDGYQVAEFFQFVQPVAGLPRFATMQRRQVLPHRIQSAEDRHVDRPVYFGS